MEGEGKGDEKSDDLTDEELLIKLTDDYAKYLKVDVNDQVSFCHITLQINAQLRQINGIRPGVLSLSPTPGIGPKCRFSRVVDSKCCDDKEP